MKKPTINNLIDNLTSYVVAFNAFWKEPTKTKVEEAILFCKDKDALAWELHKIINQHDFPHIIPPDRIRAGLEYHFLDVDMDIHSEDEETQNKLFSIIMGWW